MKIFLKLLRESFLFAMHEIAVNKVRTLLSLLGITIGIFSIIAVFTIFDSMELAIREDINSLGNNVVFIQKMPWETSPNAPWWKYFSRPEITLADLKEIEKRTESAESAAFMVGVRRTFKYANNSIDNGVLIAISQNYEKVMNVDIDRGRFISPAEFISGRNVAVIGSTIADQLLRGLDPIGRRISIFGIKVEVIGVFKVEGNSLGSSSDEQVFIPVNFARNYIDFRNTGPSIIVKAKPNVSVEELKDELTGVMRSVRRLKPKAEDNFAINELDIIQRVFDEVFGIIALVGWIIGGFSLLVGGFGIANIMFVSVKERTNIIGIQKAMGAKNYFILLQFLFEAIFLSVFGGVIGIIIVFLLTLIVSASFDIPFVLTEANIMLGIFVSAFIGFVSGFIPALNASRLDPVEAMRSTF